MLQNTTTRVTNPILPIRHGPANTPTYTISCITRLVAPQTSLTNARPILPYNQRSGTRSLLGRNQTGGGGGCACSPGCPPPSLSQRSPAQGYRGIQNRNRIGKCRRTMGQKYVSDQGKNRSSTVVLQAMCEVWAKEGKGWGVFRLLKIFEKTASRKGVDRPEDGGIIGYNWEIFYMVDITPEPCGM